MLSIALAVAVGDVEVVAVEATKVERRLSVVGPSVEHPTEKADVPISDDGEAITQIAACGPLHPGWPGMSLPRSLSGVLMTDQKP